MTIANEVVTIGTAGRVWDSEAPRRQSEGFWTRNVSPPAHYWSAFGGAGAQTGHPGAFCAHSR
ncbi:MULTISPECIES: hypothetical protein [Streptomyces violaceusniger group]|uniref:hypothetical protein n=1 Tax=Streptomyces violaceusniger group TaxID=2839105 RepID=UPI000A3D5FD9|nr:hypothetical protein [Streptomyces rhizosphaericus]